MDGCLRIEHLHPLGFASTLGVASTLGFAVAWLLRVNSCLKLNYPAQAQPKSMPRKVKR